MKFAVAGLGRLSGALGPGPARFKSRLGGETRSGRPLARGAGRFGAGRVFTQGWRNAGGLFTGRTWARGVAVVFATLNAIGQIGLITAFPLFSILLIVLDVLVIYHLTVAWESGPPPALP